MKPSLLFLYLLLIHAGITLAQQRGGAQDAQLALQYFEQKEYDKANVYFENLFDKNPDQWFPYYFKSLMAVKAYDKAEKISRKQIKNHKEDVSYYVYLGKTYKAQEESKKEKEAYEKALKELNPQQYLIQPLAMAFIEEGLYDYALEAYRKGRKATPDYPYYYEIAEVYKKKGDLTAMINEYLDAIDFRETELGAAQMALQNNLGYDDEEGGIKNPLLKQELQKRIQKYPEKVVFTDFLIFIQKQQRDFDGAFIQSKALDKRLKEGGNRIFELAQICVRNQRWETAQRCYQYLIDKGPDNMYYDAASVDILNVEYNLATQKPKTDPAELTALETKYQKLAEKYKGTSLYATIIKSQSTLQAYYLNKTQVAIDNLNELVTLPGLDNPTKAEYKILLADIYLLAGQIWDASLLYSQVEKDFKYEPIGQEAKFKNAKLSFYAGDFKWAKTQADVLKGATSKLIANDALDLSLVITDAIGVDTNDLPLKLFASADLMMVQHRYTEAINRMDSVNKLFPENTLGDDIYFKKADIYIKQGNFKEAEQQYKNILDYYPTDLYGDDAQFKLAELYELKLNDIEKARQTYQEVLTKYPGSIYVVEARKRYRQLRGDNINN
ncbi:MAG: tetratricopeptide repeat protein [Sediminibacterium sp.]|nr:tetratricopeptide repeat protein [Sediminibacterium sp.]